MQKLKRFFRVSQHNLFMFKTGTTVQKIIYIYIYIYIFRSILDHFVKKFLEHLRLYFLDPSVQRFLLCYSQSIQFTKFIQHMITHHSCSTHQAHIRHTIQSHIKHHACSVLILSRDFLGNHIPKPQHRAIPSYDVLTPFDHGLSPNPSIPRFSFT